jgi:hypothetical protein
MEIGGGRSGAKSEAPKEQGREQKQEQEQEGTPRGKRGVVRQRKHANPHVVVDEPVVGIALDLNLEGRINPP